MRDPKALDAIDVEDLADVAARVAVDELVTDDELLALFRAVGISYEVVPAPPGMPQLPDGRRALACVVRRGPEPIPCGRCGVGMLPAVGAEGARVCPACGLRASAAELG